MMRSGFGCINGCRTRSSLGSSTMGDRRCHVPTVPIDTAARDGNLQLVFSEAKGFALVRWADDGWRFPGGQPLDFEPTAYRPSPETEGLAA